MTSTAVSWISGRARWLAIGVALISTACAGSGNPIGPIGPSTALPPQRLTLALSGQSNAVGLAPFLTAAGHTVIGHGYSSAPIRCWDQSDECWRRLATGLMTERYLQDNQPPLAELPTILPTATVPLDALIWWQGESDPVNPTYQQQLEVLIAATRALLHQPDLFVVLMQLGPGVQGNAADQAQALVIAKDQRIRLVHTRDLSFVDGIHLTADGYQQVVGRIVEAAVRAPR